MKNYQHSLLYVCLKDRNVVRHVLSIPVAHDMSGYVIDVMQSRFGLKYHSSIVQYWIFASSWKLMVAYELCTGVESARQSWYKTEDNISADLQSAEHKNIFARRYASASLCESNLSVRLFVHLSVCHTPVYCHDFFPSLSGSSTILVSDAKFYPDILRGSPSGGLKQGWGGIF